MDSKPQNGVVRHSRWRALLAGMLVAGGLGAGEAWADIQVHVMNCTSDGDLTVQAFDSKDSVKAVAASTAHLNSSGDSSSLHCAGEGKGYCQMIIAITDKPIACAKAGGDGISGSVQFHLDSGKWAVVTGFEMSGDSCKPIYQVNLDSASCSN
jgi:hypothetical protein